MCCVKILLHYQGTTPETVGNQPVVGETERDERFEGSTTVRGEGTLHGCTAGPLLLRQKATSPLNSLTVTAEATTTVAAAAAAVSITQQQ